MICCLFSSFFPGRFGRVIITAKDGDRNLIRREVFQELRILDEIIQNATVHYDGQTFNYNDVCARWENDCFQNDILNLDYLMDDVSYTERIIFFLIQSIFSIQFLDLSIRF